MSDAEIFRHTISNFEDLFVQAAGIDTADESYRRACQLAADVFQKVSPIRKRFVDACLGTPYESIPSASLSFPDRFLRKNFSRDSRVGVTLRALIEEVFDLGLMYHLIYKTFPTRDQLETVEVEALFERWAPESLVADFEYREYDRDQKRLPSKIHKICFLRKVEPILKVQLQMGYWRRMMAASFFRNAFFAGAHLGLMYDLSIKGL